MNTLILVLVLITVSAAILTCVAFYRGSFRLASPPTGPKVQFILMRKNVTSLVDAKDARESAKPSGLNPAILPSPSDR
jgi:hypothetical protein